LIMDEPTNDLDAETLELLEELVADYAGTLLLVSHDRAFLDNVVTSTLVFEAGAQINEYVGGYSDWLHQKSVQPKRSVALSSSGAATPSVAALKKRRLSFNEQRELVQLPEKIQNLEAEQVQLTALISDPTVFQRTQDQGTQALQRLQSIAEELDTAYARWETLDKASGA
jgi:ATP-binding cassette subfamily F protein uup